MQNYTKIGELKDYSCIITVLSPRFRQPSLMAAYIKIRRTYLSCFGILLEFQDFGGNSRDNRIIGNRFIYNRVCPYRCIIANTDASKYYCTTVDMHIVTYCRNAGKSRITPPSVTFWPIITYAPILQSV